VIPEALAVAPALVYVSAILAGLDGPEDELIIPFLIAQVAGFVQYAYALHLRFKYHGGRRK
jgi:hypothetical protein